MNKRPFIIILCILLLSLAACSSSNQATLEKKLSTANKNNTSEEDLDSDKSYVTTGYIVKKDDHRIEVVPEITKEEIMDKSEEELEGVLKEKYEGQGVSFEFVNMEKVDKDTVSALRTGQKVIIEHDMNGLSSPRFGGNTLAIKIEEQD